MPWMASRALRSHLRRVSTIQNSALRREAPVSGRFFHHSTHHFDGVVPLRKQLKDAAKVARQAKTATGLPTDALTAYTVHPDWELTVGIEIHAQLNTPYKLFSSASTEHGPNPNASVFPFDLALPGSHPIFQPSALIPALRAALALNCEILLRSTFDRKHYFYHDQPAGYQITQYYQPFARNGSLSLRAEDGLPAADGVELQVGIKQIQLEQDTARTQEQDLETSLIDFNRSGHALIEIISLPHIHSPEAAAAYVRKVQSILYAIDAATTGMELGGLRADVNVSVRPRNSELPGLAYSGVTGLGQRTEIKNLSSFKAVEDAVKAETVRQITTLEAGGTIEGETRGWSLTNPTITHRLRGKEGEVDYRYMPDPDIAPLYIAPELVDELNKTLPPVPQQLLHMLQTTYQLSSDDAKAMLSLESGDRLIYYQDVVDRLWKYGVSNTGSVIAANWVLHELGALLATGETAWTPYLVSAQHMADLLYLLIRGKITGPSAKKLLKIIFDGDAAFAPDIADREGLIFEPMSDVEYQSLAHRVVQAHPTEAAAVRLRDKKAQGKLKFLLGQMMQQGERNRIEALRAEKALQDVLSDQICRARLCRFDVSTKHTQS